MVQIVRLILTPPKKIKIKQKQKKKQKKNRDLNQIILHLWTKLGEHADKLGVDAHTRTHAHIHRQTQAMTIPTAKTAGTKPIPETMLTSISDIHMKASSQTFVINLIRNSCSENIFNISRGLNSNGSKLMAYQGKIRTHYWLHPLLVLRLHWVSCESRSPHDRCFYNTHKTLANLHTCGR